MSATMQGIPVPYDTPGLLVHGAGPAAQDMFAGLLRSATNATAAVPSGTVVEIVIQGPGVALLVAGSALTAAIAEVIKCGVRVLACENSMHSAGLELHQLLPGISSVPAAIAHLAQRQWEGWAYVRL